MTSDPHEIAARLGLDEATVRRLQARGALRSLDLTHAEARERLYRAIAAAAERSARVPSGASAHGETQAPSRRWAS